MSIKKNLREGLLGEGVVTLKVDIPIPNNVLVLNNIFTDNGYELYLVGGAVRDFLLDKPIKDYDLATNAVPDDIERILKASNIKTIGTGQKFGIINAFVEGDEFEIATFREDSSSGDGRRPDSVTFSDIKTDVNRRDLTINALFYNLATKEIVDYVGGIEDIKNGVVRTVGEPSKRFEEDKLRILRAIRFANRTGNGLDPKIDEFLRNGYDLNEISSERIRDEFLKSISSAISVKSLMEMYDTYGMFRWIFPNLSINNNFIDEDDITIVLGNLLVDNNVQSLGKRMNALNYTINEIRDIRFLIALVDALEPNNAPLFKKQQAVTTVTDVQILKLGSLTGVEKRLLDAFNKYSLSINGQDVMDKYDISGQEVGVMIDKLERGIFYNLYNS